MTRVDDIGGMKFGRWRVVALHPERGRSGEALWLCRCDCDRHTERLVCGYSLRRGASRSCGCFAREQRRKRLTTHGMTKTRAYRCWQAMLQRCFNPNNKAHPNYGGRGITVCERWLSFVNFWIDMGDPPPGLTLDRIDNSGNYQPSNCRWASYAEQIHNRRPFKRRKGRRAELAEIQKFAASLTRAASAAGGVRAAP
jgi:hypothetical protein